MNTAQMIAAMLAMYTFGIITGGFIAALAIQRHYHRRNDR